MKCSTVITVRKYIIVFKGVVNPKYLLVEIGRNFNHVLATYEKLEDACLACDMLNKEDGE